MTTFAIGFDKAQADYDHAEPDNECRCPDDCDTCSPGEAYCCGRCTSAYDDGPDPDRIRDERIDREFSS